MAETTPLISLTVLEWAKTEIASYYQEALRLSAEESPESEPYRSLYSAREQLIVIKTKLDSLCPLHVKENTDDYTCLCACLHLQLGLNYMATDEISQGQKELELALEVGKTVQSTRKVGFVMLTCLSQLGVLWGNRSEYNKSLEVLMEAKMIYESCSSRPFPPADKDWLLGDLRVEEEREQSFEDLYTHTLFYIAQVYTHLDKPKLSAEYCQKTLCRQLDNKLYDPLEWSLNAATISQYYINVGNFPQARHCLAAATVMLSRLDNESIAQEPNEILKEKLDQTAADINRCWIKYCITLLETSCDNEEQSQSDSISSDNNETIQCFQPLELTDVEKEVSCEVVKEFPAARLLFLFGQQHVEKAKEYFTLQDHASDHVAIVQDHSRLFKYLTVFESDLSRKCRMHKRRIDMLSSLLSELNPQYFQVIICQILFELGDIYKEMADLKTVLTSEEEIPSAHAINKINSLVNNGIIHYQKYVDSFSTDVPIDPVYLRSFLVSKLNICRLNSKLLCTSSAEQIHYLQIALQGYQWLVDYETQYVREVKEVFEEEIVLCREMTQLLPQKIELLKSKS